MTSNDLWMGTIGVCYLAVGLAIIAFIAYLLYGPSFVLKNPFLVATATSTISIASTTAPAPLPEPVIVTTAPLGGGTVFNCAGGKSLAADFSIEGSVSLSLSDGRSVVLPSSVSDTGEISYQNTDGSFVFRNSGHTVFVEENLVKTYADCTTP